MENSNEISKLVRVSSVFAVIAGIVLLVADVLLLINGEGNGETPMGRVSSWCFYIGALNLVLGLPGIYLHHAKKAGTLGLIAFMVALLGSALMVTADWGEVFIFPLFAQVGVTEAPVSIIPSFIATFLTYIIGWLLFGISIIRAGVYPRWIGIMLSVAVIVGFADFFTSVPVVWEVWYGTYLICGLYALNILKKRNSSEQLVPYTA